MLQSLIPALRITLVLAVLTGLIFPFIVTAVAQLFFPEQANGSLIRNHAGLLVGAKLIGQEFTGAKYFHPRPSAAGYSGVASSGTNLGPTSYQLILGKKAGEDPGCKAFGKAFLGIAELAQTYRRINYLSPHAQVPVDAVTRSGSGLDPDISVDNAIFQAHRVAKVRAIPLPTILKLVSLHTEGRQFGLLGQPRVNVLMLNIALDEDYP